MRGPMGWALMCATLAIIPSCDSGTPDLVPCFGLRWNSLFDYDIGAGGARPRADAPDVGYLGVAGSHQVIRLEAGRARWFHGGFGSGDHVAAKILVGRMLRECEGFEDAETVIGFEIQVGRSGHTPPVVLGLGAIWGVDSGSDRAYVATGMGF